MNAFELGNFLPYQLAVLSERISRRLSVEYADAHSLSVAEWRVIAHLSRSKSVSVRDIQTFVNLEKPRVSRAVARLETLGLVHKRPGASDARLVEISLTKKGEEALEDILPRALAFERGLLSAISKNELGTFLQVMEQIHEVLDSDPAAKPRQDPDRRAREQ